MKYKGFTLPEVLLSITLLSVITGITVPAYRAFLLRNELDTSTIALVHNLRRAQALARSSDGDMSWGVRVGVGSILVYKGINYISRDSLFDENTSIPTIINPSGLQEVTFSKAKGIPNATGTFIFTSDTGEVRTILINEKGTIDY
jgi:prepilin-type N-terminal cleavage/methylation domain-containing protein